MTRWGQLHILVSIAFAVTIQGIPDATFISAEVSSTNATQMVASSIGNGTAHYVTIPKRKAVLTLLSNTNDTVLRSKKDKSSKTITCLKYEEYDDEGKLLNSVFMYNLQQVADFFREYLDTVVCNQECINK